MKITKYLAITLFTLVMGGCQNYDLNKESVTTGKLKVGVDESYSLMMESQLFVFNQLYNHADVTAMYGAEGDIIQALLDDSIQSAIICRALTDQELEFFKNKQRLPESTKIGVDALALVLNPANMDSTFQLDQLKQIFTGQITQWNQINPKSDLGAINIVFDNNKSCNERTVKEQLTGGAKLPDYCFAVHSNKEVIDYVNTHKNAIGVISVSWISDQEDPTVIENRKKIKVAGIIDPSNTDRPELARRPFQAYIYDKTYPLRRDIYVIRTGLRGTLGTGFASHLAGEKGQLIIHKMGMVTATPPTRVVKIAD